MKDEQKGTYLNSILMTLDWDQISCKKHAPNAPVIRVASTIDNGDHIDANTENLLVKENQTP